MKIYPDDWRVRLTTAGAIAVCTAAALLFGYVVGIERFLPGVLQIIVACSVGVVLGNLVVRLLFPPTSDRPPEHPPDA